jgi:thioredoxin 1
LFSARKVLTMNAALAHAELRVVTDATWDEAVMRADRPVLVDHWAVWCPPCRAMSAILADIARRHRTVLDVVTVNSDDNPAITMSQKVMAMPTFQLFKGGELVWQVVGARSRAKLLAEIGEHVDLT